MGYLNQLANNVNQTAREKGWWEEDRALPELLALAHSELSEALESWRKGEPPEHGEAKPEGWGIELIDCVIRILDMCHQFGLDADGMMERKMRYNRTRPYRHGGKWA